MKLTGTFLRKRIRWNILRFTIVALFAYFCIFLAMHEFYPNGHIYKDDRPVGQGKPKFTASNAFMRNVLLNVTMRVHRNSTEHVMIRDPVRECEHRYYGDLSRLPSASVITCFHHGEELAQILHTLHSIVQRTPPQLLTEIIIVDDNSHREEHKEILENYVHAVFPTTKFVFYRSSVQLGLIKARAIGAELATGPALVVMDIHVEVQNKWMEALMTELYNNERTLASSYLDWMKPGPNGTWKYEHGSSSCWTYWTWDFGVGFEEPPDYIAERVKDRTSAVESPATIGTVWGINKKFFNEIGGLDEEMWGWGGENVDISVRTWLFGGRVVNVPCSHVAHLEKDGLRSYRQSWYKQTMRNFHRAVETWGTGYRNTFYQHLTEMKSVDPGDVSACLGYMARAKYDLKTHLERVYPQLLTTIPELNSYAFGGVKNTATGECLDRNGKIIMQPCHYILATQGFFYNTAGELRHKTTIISSEPSGEKRVLWEEPFIMFHNASKTSRWIHWKGGHIMHQSLDICFEATSSGEVMLAPCRLDSPYQMWTFRNYTDNYHRLVESRYTKKGETLNNLRIRELSARYNFTNVTAVPSTVPENFLLLPNARHMSKIRKLKLPFLGNRLKVAKTA